MRSRRRDRASTDPDLARAFGEFRAVLRDVDRAQASLVAAAPSRRGEGAPLAEALAGFEEALAAARSGMAGWRVEAVEDDWARCAGALEEAGRRAERVRLQAAPQGYEEVAALLADVLDPLEEFAGAVERFRALGA